MKPQQWALLGLLLLAVLAAVIYMQKAAPCGCHDAEQVAA
jgi:hypothetical protein